MIAHYFKVVWNRKRANALILTEILVSFLVLCFVLSVAAYYVTNWRKPLGFDYRNVWTLVAMIPDRDLTPESALRNLEVSRQLIAAVKTHPEVEVIAPGANTPYSGSMNRQGIYLADHKLVQFQDTSTFPEMRDALKLNLIAGRWLEEGDAELDFRPMVITENLARRVFGREDPLGKTIEAFDEKGEPRPLDHAWERMVVVGVLSEYRRAGELSDAPLAAFEPQNMTDPDRAWSPWSYVIRLAPGTPAAFEEDLLNSLRAVAPTWGFEVNSVEHRRQDYLKSRFLPLAIGGTLAGFLLVMVGMGLLGVLWQNVTRRTQELGLRRALGATAGGVRNQVLGEILMLATLGMGLGTVLFLQVPLLGIVPFVDFGVFVTATLLALLVLYPFVILCGLYPGWLATRVQPARALQYE